MNAYTPNLITDTALSVAGLTDYIQVLLEQDDHLRQVWVIGEVSSAHQHSSGLFFTMQDPHTKAVVSCVVWTSQLSKLAQVPVKGEQLMILGSIRIYAQKGQYQLTVWQALPAGEGLQELRYRQLRNRLQSEGLFDISRKRPLPPHPQTIAVVTSSQAAAWGDIQKTLQARYPGLKVLFSPAIVQGDQAADSIVAAIDRVNKDARAEVLILARGGGAVEDLACFNDEKVVWAIANCAIPVITGIGHQRDESLADLVADFSAHTPTAAAEKVVPKLATLYSEHQERLATLIDVVNHRWKIASEKLAQLQARQARLPIINQINQQQQRLNWKRQQLLQATTRRLETATQHCQMLGQKLAVLDPKAVLQRGYAVVRTEHGAIARSTEQLLLEQKLTIQLSQGQVNVKIIEILNSND